MGLIERIVACGSCGYTGTTHPGRHSPEPLASSCYVCEAGTMVEFVNPAIVRAVAENERLRGVLARIAAGHAHPSKLAGEALDAEFSGAHGERSPGGR